MRVEYAGIELEDVSLQGWEREAVLNGPDYLYTRFKLHVRGIFNPFSTSYRLASVPGTPTSEDGQLAALTDVAIRHRLLQARQQLYVWMDQGDLNGRSYMLVSPLPINPVQPTGAHYSTDANNGPFPVACHVSQIGGTKTFLVDFIIQTDINECGLAVANPAVVLSHRWTMTDDIDEQFLTTRTIQGKIILAVDRMKNSQKEADDFRRIIVHPVGPNMKRVGLRIGESADGNTLEYEIKDREQAANIGGVANGLGVVKIECVHTTGLTNSSSMEAALGSAISSGIQTAVAVGTQLSGIVGAILGLGQGALAAAPKQLNRIAILALGNRDSTLANLELACRTLLANRLGRGPDVNLNTINYATSHHLHDKKVEMILEYMTGPLTAMFGSGPGRVARISFVNPLGLRDEDVTGVLQRGEIINPRPPRDGNSRGTFLSKLLAATLRSPCQNTDTTTPPSPPSAPR